MRTPLLKVVLRTLFCVELFMVTSCGTALPVRYPADWPTLVSSTTTNCLAQSGEYVNSGTPASTNPTELRKPIEAISLAELTDPRYSAGRAVRAGGLKDTLVLREVSPDSFKVSLRSQIATNAISTLGNFTCGAGVLGYKVRSDRGYGEGTSFVIEVELTLLSAMDGSLVVHENNSSRRTDYGVFRSTRTTEYWYRFPRVVLPNESSESPAERE